MSPAAGIAVEPGPTAVVTAERPTAVVSAAGRPKLRVGG
jgi:hypothetical protein